MATDEQTAARITEAQIASLISSEIYFRPGAIPFEALDFVSGPIATYDPDQQSVNLLTICVLVLTNGFTVVGKSACVSASNFDKEVGKKFARQDAVNQIWALEGYLLKQRIHEAGKA